MLVVGLFFGAAGVWLLSMTFRLYTAQQDIRTHAEHATGTVVDFKQTVETRAGKSYRRTTYFAPVFTFIDRAGVPRRVTSKVSQGDKPGYQVGQKVPVVYHHDRPDEAELDTFFAIWGGILIAGGLGAAFFLVGGLVASVGARRLLWPGPVFGTTAKPSDSIKALSDPPRCAAFVLKGRDDSPSRFLDRPGKKVAAVVPCPEEMGNGSGSHPYLI